MDLVLVEFMILPGYVLNNPFFHRSLRGHDRWRIVVVEECWLLARAHLGNEELGGLNLAELEGTRGRRAGCSVRQTAGRSWLNRCRRRRNHRKLMRRCRCCSTRC